MQVNSRFPEYMHTNFFFIFYIGGRCSSETSQQLKIIIQQIYKCKYLCCCKSQDSTSKFFIYVQLFSSKENWEFQNSNKI